MKWRIRKATKADAKKLQAFLASHAGAEFSRMARDYTACMFSDDYRRPVFLIAVEGGDIIGSAACSHEMFTLLPMWGISWVNVRADRRNRGLGGALLAACIENIRKKNR